MISPELLAELPEALQVGWLETGLQTDYLNAITGLLMHHGKVDRTVLAKYQGYSAHLRSVAQRFGRALSDVVLGKLVNDQNGAQELDRLAEELRAEAAKDILDIPWIHGLCMQQARILLGEEGARDRLGHLVQLHQKEA